MSQQYYATRKKPVSISSLNAGCIAITDYFGVNGEILIAKGTVITQRQLDRLEDRNNFDLYISSARDDDPGRIDAEKPEPLDHPGFPEFPTTVKKPAITPPDGRKRSRSIDIFTLPPGQKGLVDLSKSPLAAELDRNLLKKNYVDRPIGQPLKNKISQISAAERTETYKEKIARSYRAALDETETLLLLLAGNQNADAADLEHIVKRFVAVFISDRNILLNISGLKSSKNDPIFQHSLNVSLLAINIAAAYGYNEKQVLEIGMGALVHDIGMLLIPKSIRLKKTRLTEEEWCEIQKHPILALHLLQNLKNMSERIPYIAYQVHERENATGYPRQHCSPNIHRFAKMVEVADIYEALTSPRPHRPAYLPNLAVHKLIQMSEKKLLPPDAIKAFLEYVSLYPVGSTVELNDHCICKVVHANGAATRQPMVSVLIDEKGKRIDPADIRQIDLARRNDLRIVKTLPPDSIKAITLMDGF